MFHITGLAWGGEGRIYRPSLPLFRLGSDVGSPIQMHTNMRMSNFGVAKSTFDDVRDPTLQQGNGWCYAEPTGSTCSLRSETLPAV